MRRRIRRFQVETALRSVARENGRVLRRILRRLFEVRVGDLKIVFVGHVHAVAKPCAGNSSRNSVSRLARKLWKMRGHGFKPVWRTMRVN